MPLQATSGAASYDAFGGGVPVAANYIEDVFSTWLYTGNGSTQTITNGIDIAGKGALVWTKCRSDSTLAHRLNDTERGITNRLFSNLTNAQSASATSITATSSTGYTVGSENGFNENTKTFASWTFRKAPKFFDVVTYTGNGTAGRTVAHNLGSVPGCIIIKKTSDTENWGVYHRSLGNTASLALNLTSASGSGFWNNTTPTDTVFTLGNQGQVNDNGQTYVAYLFAHNAGGFGLSGTDNVISCGSFTSNGSGVASVNLGYEPQWILAKQTNGTTAWFVIDNMRGFPVKGTASRFLSPNNSTAENGTLDFSITNTGFDYDGASDAPFIYIAIRRGPMRTPTTGTSVYNGIASSGANGTVLSVGFPADADLWASRGTAEKGFTDRLRGFPVTNAGTMPWLVTQSTAAEAAYSGSTTVFNVDNTSATIGSYVGGLSGVHYFLRRAPGFFDEVCYTGNGGSRTVAHNLGVAPELMIIKSRSSASYQWVVYCSYLTAPTTSVLCLNLNIARDTGYTNFFDSTAPSASVITLGVGSSVNNSGDTYVAYLFASCPGVSKVGSYTGTGATQTINCGFTGGARFVMIKRTDSTGDWYVWDTARGIVSGNDPHLSLNTTAAEVTSNDTIDTDSTGFVVNQVSATNVNVSSATYIFMAVA